MRLRAVGVKTPAWVLGPVLMLVIGCGPNPRPPDPPRSLFERLGGSASLQLWVDELAWRLAADPRLGDTFVRVDLGALKTQMLQMTCAVTGGRCAYDLDRLSVAHEAIALTDTDVERFLEIASEAASAVGLPERPATELVDRLRTLRSRLGPPSDRVGSDR